MEKKKYKVLKPISLDGRKEPGEIVELTDEEVQAFSKEDLEAVVEEKVDGQKENEESENQESDDSDESDSEEK